MSTAFGEALRQARERRGLKKAQMARIMGITGPAISQWESGATEPELQRFLTIVKILGLNAKEGPFLDYMIENTGVDNDKDLEEILSGKMVSSTSSGLFDRFSNIGPSTIIHAQELDKSHANLSAFFEQEVLPKKAPSFKSIQGLARDIPVYGIAVGGDDGDFQFNGTEADRVTRPPGLANARDIFALYVVNDSMYPAWREGALFYVNPNRPPVIGDDVVVEVRPRIEGEAGAAFLKRLKARRGNTIVVEQFNPPKEIEFDRDAVRLYRVIPWEEALGLS